MKVKSKRFKQVLCMFLCFAMVLGFNMGFAPAADAAGIDVGANPTPKVDIAVNVPADYPGTFLDFKQELALKLVEQGLNPSDFRITTTAVSIDTTDTSGWIVYDHYRDNSAYTAAIAAGKISGDPSLAPNRTADNSHSNGSGTIESYFPNGVNNTGNKCKQFDRHILSSQDDEGKASMIFVGYGTSALADYMIYPAASNARRNFSFDINPAVIDTHTLSSYGFFLNAGISGGQLNGYALIFSNSHVGSIQKISGLNANAAGISGSVVKSGLSMGISTGQVARLTVELNKNSVTIQVQKYDSNGNLTAPVDMLRDFALDDTGFNGFGPLVNYSSHGCASLSIMKYSDLEMSYEASAFDALKNVQYYEGAEQKYFINLTGTNNNPGIPNEFEKDGKTPNKHYHDGINRMNENEIFYISNTDDGQIVTDSNEDTNHQGLGSSNGFYAGGDSYVELIAQYIATNSRDGVKFQQQQVKSDLPLANFYIRDAHTADKQMMTIHLQHLVNSNETVPVNIFDKSRIGTLSGEDGSLVEYTLTITDPNNKVVKTQKVDDPSKLDNYVFTKDSVSGRYTFTLVVKDSKGNESKDFSTYITAFLDNKFPYIEGENTRKNIATITLTDTGAGIDEDGITFIEDNRGSGVAGYFVTNDPNYTPTEDDFEMLPFAQHQYSFDLDIESTDPIIVWTRDECANVGAKAVFQPTYVRVEDADGNPIDDYYVISEKPIIVLPTEEERKELGIEPPPDSDDYFSGWITGGENPDPVTPGTDVPKNDDHTIIIRPNYARDYATIVYIGNGGTINMSGSEPAERYADDHVIDKASIYSEILESNIIPVRRGYSFTGWMLLKTTTDEQGAVDSVKAEYINNAANLEAISTQRAIVEKKKDDQGNDINGQFVKKTYYLVAQWKEGEYTLRLDPNGGSVGNMRSIEGIKFGTNLGGQFDVSTSKDGIPTTAKAQIPVSGRGIPSKPGYFFCGWSEQKLSTYDAAKVFKAAKGYNGTAQAPVMPDGDKTIYAVWLQDTNKFIVSFDSNGGSKIGDQAYLTSTATKYDTFMKPSRTGYTFAGWFEKTVDDEGNVTMGTTEYVGGEGFIRKANHSFIAKWEPNVKTKYTVDYYVNSGKKDDNGQFIYVKMSELSKTYEAATEAQVSVPAADRKTTVTVGATETDPGVKYWYLGDSFEKNVLSGEVTGSPALSLKLYYDRYFNVEASQKGEGTVTGFTNVKEGENPTVTWEPAEGYYVSKVVIDGAVRDDLLNAKEYTFPAASGIHEDHRIYVVFTSDTVAPKPTVNPNPPVEPVDRYFEVNTQVVGCSDASKYTITPSTSVKEGSNHHVEWAILDSNYTIVKVEVDGEERSVADTSVDFNGISGNHNVVVTVKPLPTIGGGTTEGQYTITVNRYGGDDKVSVSETMVVNKGDTAKIEWNVNDSEYRVVKILLDGESFIDVTGKKAEIGSTTKKPLNSVQGNHVVDIYFGKPDPENPDGPVPVPDFTDESYVQVTTQLIGAPGTITGGAVVSSGENYDVDWDVVTKADDAKKGTDEYFYYEIEKVEVNGADITSKDENGNTVTTNVALNNITEDTNVKVYVKPVLHRVTILKYGEGTVSPSKTVYHLDDYNNIGAQPGSGWSLARIDVDGEMKYSVEVYSIAASIEGGNGTITGGGKVNSGDSRDISWTVEAGYEVESIIVNGTAVEGDELSALITAGKVELSNITSDQSVVVKLRAIPAPEVPENTENTENAENNENTPAPENSATPEVPAAPENSAAPEVPAAPENSAAPEVPAAPESTPASESSAAPEVPAAPESTVSEDENSDTNEQSDEQPALVAEGVSFRAARRVLRVRTLVLDDTGVTAPGTGGFVNDTGLKDQMLGQAYGQNTIVVDHVIEVYFTKNEQDESGNTVPTPITDEEIESLKKVTVTVNGGPATVSEGNAIVKEGENATVNWKLTDTENYELESVTVNGTPVEPTANADGTYSIPIDGITEDKNVQINLKKKTVDKDDEVIPPTLRKSSYNVVTTIKGGTGTITGGGTVLPGTDRDVSWTVDEGMEIKYIFVNGEQRDDLLDKNTVKLENINADQSVVIQLGQPNKDPINVDKDGDGEPDINIDKDGDGEPDINIDTDGDGDPDINIDTDDDGEPDVNVDTDDDGKPDINIDKDGDGEPDINIDKDGDGKPDVNVDTDDDGDPDINIDTDDDGKPDINIDKDGDSKPDLNIDKDGDGIPDINIDINDDGKPEINIDTNGDGEPDLNIDTNKDGIPDANLDMDGDGKVDSYGSVKTGDVDMTVFVVLMFLSAAALAVVIIKKKSME